ncbi:class I SAM-dependent methyltransferase [Crateriforma conspicua]|uniref:Mg-protoporphyrin IX methyl transferase n=1 Tax=Crateriforma conspicua TaxID=2527996 RepID=A0A5C5XYQ3_9PLAN|nr:class I SAM-dependent methyltransferase [Crateriforma conspicua]QDV63114.1 Mg-protoporphyrin IX methyl transferase [Crateriforma conspicua]TWT68120.1 Mg-protoporphyrin IX methyl transferase [Crateriforma conspicua]
MTSPSSTDPFYEAYDRDDVAYGMTASAMLSAYLNQVGGEGDVYDLAAGAGRDTIALAKSGFHVTAIDISQRGLDRIAERSATDGCHENVNVICSDVRDVDFPTGTLAGVVATTMLDHIPAADAQVVWDRICGSLRGDGFLYAEVHTTEDPGCDQPPGCDSSRPVSETASAVVNYFRPNQLAQWAVRPESGLRILQYAERIEWDYTHGPEHAHGKAVLLAVRDGHHPDWLGQPPAFPRRPRPQA